MYLFLSFADRRYLNDLVEGAKPKEACGFLFGKSKDEAAIVLKIMPADNALDSPLAFEISPSEVFKAFDEADKLGLEIIGVYHSHPAPPKPSEIDLRYMKVNPMLWLIISMLDHALEAYYLSGEEVKRLEILP